jgi:surface antigen
MEEAMDRMRKGVSLLLVGAALASCANPPGGGTQQASGGSCAVLGPKALTGVAAGGLAGAGIGAAVARNKAEGALIGLAAGALMGAFVGKTLDERDCEQAQVAMRQMAAARTGQMIAWNNAANGDHGTLTPLSDPAPNANGQMCRQYKRDQVIGGTQTGGDVGVVCRTADGDYQVVQ